MTKTQVKQACALYTKELSEHGYYADSDGNQLDHIMTMLPKIPTIMESNPEKAFRWFGFVQGALYTRGIFTIEEMKAH